uniref:Putative viral protein found on panstrongylus lignarius transcriptome n=1 Tax=Panstrongylus lignarius TaxID=156445 RepID=A0A224XJD2_9HEMI
MRLIKQHDTLSVQNLDDRASTNKESKHGLLFPDSIRSLICGPSNCGKTNLMLSLIYDPKGLRFENIYLFAKSLQQPKYRKLAQILEPLKDIRFFEYEDNSQVPPPKEALPNSIIIFDDIACDKQDNVRSYFCMGRHSGVDIFYLSQSYTRVPKHLVRENANFLILFRQDELNLRRIYDDHINSDMEFQTFRKICHWCWKDDRYGFLVLDKDRQINDGRYRKGFGAYIIP